jgi:hypothetical protein
VFRDGGEVLIEDRACGRLDLAEHQRPVTSGGEPALDTPDPREQSDGRQLPAAFCSRWDALFTNGGVSEG